MLLAGDVGGTKTLLGLFVPGGGRPEVVTTREYRTLEFSDLATLCLQFLRDTSTPASAIDATSFGVAGPTAGRRAQLTNVPWEVDLDALRQHLPVARDYLLNDLEALAWSIPVLADDEIEVLHEGHRDPAGSVALIAAGTGLGVALLPNIDGRLVPLASEGGHADFAPRNDVEQALATALAREYGRAEIEAVISGPGLVNIHRLLSPHTCADVAGAASADDLPAAISRAALESGCELCTRTLERFVSAYGAAAGNLAVTVLSTGGMYLGGGIAPRILPALRWPVFLRSFFDKSPMDELIARVPVKVILNSAAGLLGAAVRAVQVDRR